jgi:hypothetical protein
MTPRKTGLLPLMLAEGGLPDRTCNSKGMSVPANGTALTLMRKLEQKG